MSSSLLMSSPGAEPVVIEALFAARPARVFQAWSSADELRLWFGSTDKPPRSIEIDFRVGGNWRCTFAADDGAQDALFGQYVVIEPDRRLVFSWTHQRTASDGNITTTQPSQVTVTFEATSDGARVRLIHEAIVREAGRRGVGGGWSESFTKLSELVHSVG